MEAAELSDSELFRLVTQDDDQQAYTLLFRRHWLSLYQLILRKTGNASEAQDMIQEIFIQLWEKRHSIQIFGSPRQYMNGMVRNQVFDYFRQSQKHSEQLEQLGRYLEEAGIEDTSSETVKTRLSAETAFDNAVNNLPERIREIYLLRTRDRLSYETIAGLLNIKQQTARNAFSRAVALLTERTDSMAVVFYLVYFL